MPLEYLLYADIILASRLVYLINDGPLQLRSNLMLVILQLLLLATFWELNIVLAGNAVAILLVGSIGIFIEPRVDLKGGFRLLTLAILLLVPGYLNSLGTGLEIRQWVGQVVLHLQNALPFFRGDRSFDLHAPLLLLFGILLLGNEANIIIRSVFHHCRLEPQEREVDCASADAEIDAEEYNAGRVIGFLERWLMFIVVVYSRDFNALAFILAAKGLARMKQLENKQFAEYMLIGTLISALCAIAVGLYIAWLLQ